MNTNFSTYKLIRHAIAYVFIVSGLMKFVSTELSGYFIGLGLPFPTYLMYTVALLEIICGILIAMNRYVKKATIPLLVIIIGAILITKVPLLHTGLMQFAFSARLDIVMLVLLFILYSRYPRF